MWLAGRAVTDADKDLVLGIDGRTVHGGYKARVSGTALSDQPVTVENRGKDTVYAAVTALASPEEPLPASGNGFTIERTYYSLDGEEIDIAEATQNDRYVVVLNVVPENSWSQRLLVTDLLPADTILIFDEQ